MPALADQVVVVTGASRGIGAATAAELASRGAKVALLARDTEALDRVAAGLGDRVMTVFADINDSASLEQAVKAVQARFGRVDALVANAGLNQVGTINNGTPEAFSDVVVTNVVGTYRTLQAFLPALAAGRGYALLMSSVASTIGLGGQSAYAASKAGIESLAHTLRMETAHLGVRFGAAHPWFVDTDLLREGELRMPSMARFRARWAPLGRLPGLLGLAGRTLTPEECAVVLADMVARRSRRRYLPRSVGVLVLLGPIMNSEVGERIQQLIFGRMMRGIEADLARPAR
jgi:NAD(P)-dependent dehydrogenase (short-subunit alcohol dehydrogenase family)